MPQPHAAAHAHDARNHHEHVGHIAKYYHKLSRTASMPLRLQNAHHYITHQTALHGLSISWQSVSCRGSALAEVSTSVKEEVTDFILMSPLLQACGLTEESVKAHIDTWIELGSVVCKNLDFPDWSELDAIQKLRVYQYYLPVFFWCQGKLDEHKKQRTDGRPLVIGMNAPQGCGKTTIMEELQALFDYTGKRSVSISVDDFYLTFQDQQALAAANPTNSILQVRGNAGTHDVKLGSETLKTLTSLTAPGSTARLPRYDKSQNQGRGDRANPATWPAVEGPVDVVLFEGWMLGHPPLSDAAAEAVTPDLLKVNETLKTYKDAWDSYVDAWLVVKVATPDWVYGWRWQAEERLWKTQNKGMTEQQVTDFVDRYMPAYRAYLPPLYEKGPTTARPGQLLVIEIDASRAPVTEQPAPIM